MRVAVIGGGVIGVCTAYFLAEAGHEVSVIERYGNVAQEASFGNLDLLGPSAIHPWSMPGTTGHVLRMLFSPESSMVFSSRFEPAMWGWLRRVLTESSRRRFRKNQHRLHGLAGYSRGLMEQLAKRYGMDFQQRSGVLMMFRTEKEAIQARPLLEVLSEHEVHCDLLDPATARQLDPALSEQTSFHSALHLPYDWSGNCPLFVRQVKFLAQEIGVTFQFNSEVDSIHPGPRGVSLRCGGRQIETDAVVVAAGAGSIRLLRGIGIGLPMYPVKVYSASAPIQEYELAPQVSVFDATYRVALSRIGKRLRIAGCAELGSSNFDLQQKAINTLVKVGDDWFPSATNYRTATFWCGPVATLPEGVPLLGPTRYGNVFVNAGHGTGAWALAAGSGKLVSDLVSGYSPEIDIEGLTLNRYGDRIY